jgi:prepilin signal peptidase PulO-like enzyme (type II secretory pathway)
MAIAIAALGLAIGSFLNVVIHRLRSGETGWRSRSKCPRCGAILRPIDLIPLLSFVMLRGRCRGCKKPISWQYPLVEASVATLFLADFLVRGGSEALMDGSALIIVRDLVFISSLTVVFVIDLLDMVVFDAVTLPMIPVAAGFNLALGHDWRNLAWAAAIGGGFFLLQYVVSKGRWIGGGDIRIGAMMGAMLGFPGILAALLVAYVIGAVTALVLLALKKTTWSSQLAFGTFLSVATVLVLLASRHFSSYYAEFF